MKLLKKLANPVLLTLQGFALGAILFFATHPEAVDASGRAQVEQARLR